ncbi:MAG: hypothetical protein HONBIEJF_02289 [Fimbriimonadaceae bacterium]|nr:hypothetical protein [Fimbriimonadaceae bacterium]
MLTPLIAAMVIAPPINAFREVPFTQVRIEDTFWSPRQDVNRKVSISHSLKMLEVHGYLDNYRLAAQGKREGFKGLIFMDSDVYKVLESAAYSLATHPDPDLDKKLDEIIAILASAQMPDGYLNTWFQVKEPDRRWSNLRDAHELYCAGHLFEAAAAHHRATGKKNLLNVATKYADCIAKTFGPGNREGYCGHPEIELALVKLAEATGNRKYFDLARFFVASRGQHFFAREHKTPEDQYDGSYFQDDVPITEHKRIKGHAVRAAYLMAGAVDVAGDNDPIMEMVDRVWRNTTEKNVYITGGIGPSAHNEGFTVDYDLPNLTAYQETCASVAMILWNHRMSLRKGDGKYAEAVERSLYNGFLSGVSLSGDRFFYVNPLESKGNHHRSEWFSCACCPPNVTRTLASLGSYLYATTSDSLVVQQYVSSSGETKVGKERAVWRLTSEMPWGGKTSWEALENGHYGLMLRIPSWNKDFNMSFSGGNLSATGKLGYLCIEPRDWKAGDRVEIDLGVEPRVIEANPKVASNRGSVAIAKGPLIYCFEAVDNPGGLQDSWIPDADTILVERNTKLFGGTDLLKVAAFSAEKPDWDHSLYRTKSKSKRIELTAIPYCLWDNREPGYMRVWSPTAPPPIPDNVLEASANVSMSFVSWNCFPGGINDGDEPKNSSAHPAQLCHWWPHKGGSEWVQYEWKSSKRLSGSRIFWFDDTGRGEIRPPVSWQIEYHDGVDWKPVELVSSAYDTSLNKWCDVTFKPISTTKLRVVVQQQPQWAVGILEWRVTEAEDD